MARPIRSAARTRAVAVLAAAATVAGGAALLGPGTSSASSHREAPYIATDPSVDNTDTYAFVSPDDPSTATLIANVSPFQDPAGGPNFYPFATDARYKINVDNNSDGKPDVTFQFTFKDVDNRGSAKHGDKVGGSFLYNDGPVASNTDAHLLFQQRYSLDMIKNVAGQDVTTSIVNDVPVPPDNVGIASMPNYVALREQAIREGGTSPTGIKAFAGQRKDPFFIDLRVFDLLFGGNLSETGFNHLMDKSVNTLAVQVPKRLLAANADFDNNPVIGVYATTERQTTRTLAATGESPASATSGIKDEQGPFTQVSRLGNPLVNEVVVPANLKDYFNRSLPTQDGALLGKVQDPELPHLFNLIYKIPNPNSTPKGADRPDLVATFLTGISLKSYPPAGADLNGEDLNRDNVANPIPYEALRLNLKIPPTPADKVNRLGVIGGDLAGFPNGRRLRDDVVDIATQVMEGLLVPDQPTAVKDAVKTLSDGVNSGANGLGAPAVGDGILGSFPYVADPTPGSDVPNGATQVSFTQRFTSSNGTVTAQVTNLSPAIKGGFVQLYRVNANGSLTGFGTSQLNAAGTASIARTFRATPGTRLTLNFRVFPKRGSAAQVNRGLPTTITVR